MLRLPGWVLAALVSTVAAAGCSSSPEPNVDETAGSTSSELTLPNVVVGGALRNGETRKHPWVPSALRAYTFQAKGGDQITFDIKSTLGIPEAYITDASNVVLASSEGGVVSDDGGRLPDDDAALVPGDSGGPADADSGDSADELDGEEGNDGEEPLIRSEARVVHKLRANAPAGTYRLVFRNKEPREVLFTLKLAILSGAPVCQWLGSKYSAGSTYAANDECNTCTCKPDGASTCTTNTCSCGNEPWRTYTLQEPSKCIAVHPTCPSGSFPFLNSCGCGCERPH